MKFTSGGVCELSRGSEKLLVPRDDCPSPLSVSMCVFGPFVRFERFGYVALAISLFLTSGSNMVLQRAPLRARLWGVTKPNAAVAVRFQSKTLDTTADASGKWAILLPATPAGGPHTIRVASDAGKSPN